jgi:hypothetical protein
LYLSRSATPEGPGAYRPVADNRPQDFEKALNTAGAQGFRLLPSTLTRSGGDTLGVMQRVPRYSHCLSVSRRPFKRRVGQGNGRLGVKWAPADWCVHSAVGDGRVARTTGAPARRSRMKSGSLMNVLLERSEATAKYSYRVVGASRGSTLREEIEGAARPIPVRRRRSSSCLNARMGVRVPTSTRSWMHGFVPAALVPHGGYTILLEKSCGPESALSD